MFEVLLTEDFYSDKVFKSTEFTSLFQIKGALCSLENILNIYNINDVIIQTE